MLYRLELKLIGDSRLNCRDKTLLILRLDSIGDYILFRNFLQVIRNSEQYRDYHITLCGNSAWKSIAEQFDGKFVDAFLWTDAPGLLKFKNRFRLARAIRKSKFNTVIHPTFSRYLNNDQLVICSGAPARISYSGDAANIDPVQLESNNTRFTRIIKATDKFKFEFYRNRDFIDQLLETPCTLLKPELKVKVSETDLLVLCPGASTSSRRWSTHNFGEFIRLFKIEYPQFTVAICGGQMDRMLARQIIEESNEEILDYTGRLSLMELTEVFASAKLILSNDSGPFHIAVALDRRVICLSSGNNYGRFVPYPLEMKTRSRTVFPPAILNYKEELTRLKEFGVANEKLDINTITPLLVMESARDLLLN
jgi:ADP-heptose:LPS heptosyltransferase